MKLEIERFAMKDINIDSFLEKYLTEEKPFILTGVNSYDAEKLTPDYMRNFFAKDSSKKGLGWYNSPLVDNDVIQTPEIVKGILRRSDMSFRKQPMRAFMQPGGHVTLPHYDGNSIHVFNLQVTGRKRWVLVSSKTPLPTLPFMFAGMVPDNYQYDPEKLDFLECETSAGELLFLPRYWYHEVCTLARLNMNFTWVFTPKFAKIDNPVGKREVEMLKLRKIFPPINKILLEDFSDYGGGGSELVNEYSKNVSSFRAMTRFFKEAMKYPRAAFVYKGLKARANKFVVNNFNVPV